MNTQETREVFTSRPGKIRRDTAWFKPKTMYVLIGMVLLIALLGTLLAPTSKRDANDIISPWDSSQAPPQAPDRTAIMMNSHSKATPASQGAGAGVETNDADSTRKTKR